MQWPVAATSKMSVGFRGWAAIAQRHGGVVLWVEVRSELLKRQKLKFQAVDVSHRPSFLLSYLT